ncbi:LamG-like jellyroll fold domain-containing protein [Thalassomonas actiniarum]|uniref:LamG-like jellyroll fold domain-containing protein n=1 Tax=Thalassomonas actiniarum TaxID=485447 RepID=A0AAE9YXB6_9GAMM|nr:LamG-like jellyroll fold domain-containing protein [Thalassomonas actiniarum]WDE01223.1 hypothetical protein SG35_011595 [Thalassomonas actiniarum]
MQTNRHIKMQSPCLLKFLFVPVVALLLSAWAHAFSSPLIGERPDFSRWTAKDIGQANIPGTFTVNDDLTIQLQGSGNDIWNEADNFYYLYREVTGDTTIITKVHSVEYTHYWAKGAVMFRETLEPGSVNVALDYAAAGKVALQWRPVADERSFYFSRNAGITPVWLKLQRQGDRFTGYYSLDGSTWQLTTSQTIDMAETFYVGLAASPHVTTATNEVVFSDVALQTVEPYNYKAKVYLMAGQSNMQGHGAVSALATTSGAGLAAKRDDVFIKNIISNSRGLDGLAPGFGARSSSYGVELKMGNMLGDVLEENVYLFKGAQGGTTLDNTAHWRPLAHGGEAGNLYDQLLSGFKAFIQEELVANNIDYEIAGFIWFQGYNDTFGTQALYENHLRNLISSVRADLALPELPVVITQINDNRGSAGDMVMAAQAKVAQEDPLARLVYTADQRPYYHYGHDSYIVIGERIARESLAFLGYAVTTTDEYTASPSTVLTIDAANGVLTNDEGVTSANLVSDVSHGALVLDQDGSFEYTPAPGYVGADSFTYRSMKNGRHGNSAKVTLWVRDNTAPLVLHYDFDNSNEQVIKDTASGVPAAVVKSGISFEHPGAVNTSAYFDGNTVLHYLSEYPVYAFLDLSTEQDFSISAWVKPDAGISGEPILISNKYYYNSKWGFAFTLANNGTAIKAFVGSYDHQNHVDKSKSVIGGDINLTDGQWHHVAVTFGFTENAMKLYIDGKLVGETDLTGLSGEINKYESAIGDGSGGGNGSSQSYKGYMDELRLYRKSLSADEINNLYLKLN